MVKKIGIVIIMTILVFNIVQAQENGLGVGLIIGEPTGISGKIWTGNNTAIDGALAWSFGDNAQLHIHADYIIYKFDMIQVDEGKLPIYFGIGGRIKLNDSTKLGVRIPVGINYLFEDAPIDMFFEIVPILDLLPSTKLNFNGGVGIRYFF